MARLTKSQCHPCPARAQCTTSRENHCTVGFPSRELRDLQLRVRAEQQTPEWKTRYAVRSGVEGTVGEQSTSSPTDTACAAAATEARARSTSNTSCCGQLAQTPPGNSPTQPLPTAVSRRSQRINHEPHRILHALKQ
ncbi:transposase [Streptomyces sp. NPDC091376]|uniref:transposase n=1 Tax=Streptomyces sp. NPDC091376 TaxID=3365994 RepID=UPI003809040C